jgi:hypothetical protein
MSKRPSSQGGCNAVRRKSHMRFRIAFRFVPFDGRFMCLLGILPILSGCVVPKQSRPPAWVLQKTTDSRAAGALIQDTNTTAILDQLRIPLGPCHIEVLDLPEPYQQPADEKRLSYGLPGETKAELETRYPVLSNYLSVSRSWISDDEKTIAFLMYDSLGYFILLSLDGGAHWSSPLYLGIHRLPEAWYAPLADSKLPLVSGRKIQIEVTIWKRDMTKEGSPLMGYHYLWKKWDKYLSINLGDLIRDSDGDGLTDLFEERILTDPNSPDTDRDGLSDDVDNQPLTPFPAKMSDSDAILLSLIANIRGPLIGDIFMLWREPREFFDFDHDFMLTKTGIAYFSEPRSKRIPMNRTSLILSSGDSFPHITGSGRVIVLDENAFRRYCEKFPEESRFYVGDFDLRFDRQRKVAVLKEFLGNTGSTTILWKDRGKWLSEQTQTIMCD